MKKSKHPLYTTWASMKQRCSNPKNSMWHRYGGRGITVCSRWLSFEKFCEDMGARPDGTTLDRIDNDKGYSPENCRWADNETQQFNKEKSVFITIDGENYRLSLLAKKYGLKPETIKKRAAKGMNFEEAVAKKRYVFTGGVKKAVEVRVRNQIASEHCKRGHLWSENTLVHKQGRICRECYRMRKGIGMYKPKDHLSPP